VAVAGMRVSVAKGEADGTVGVIFTDGEDGRP
jgi:hypothetical protein